MPDNNMPTQLELVENLRKAIEEYVEEKKMNQPAAPMTVEEFKDNLAALAAKEPETSPKAEAVKRAFLELRKTYSKHEDIAARLLSFVASVTEQYGKQFLIDGGKEQAEILAGRKTWKPETKQEPQPVPQESASYTPQQTPINKETIRKIRDAIDATFDPTKAQPLDTEEPVRIIDIDTVKDYPKAPNENVETEKEDNERLETVGKQIDELNATLKELEAAAQSTTDPEAKSQLEGKINEVKDAISRLTQEKNGEDYDAVPKDIQDNYWESLSQEPQQEVPAYAPVGDIENPTPYI